ncbi:MFS transporter [Streptomyces sp. AB3(2024)]|uniref:MFS transporter n=1 Tax=Streptomyces sp. AB3(2024) TaxID=3317321 RepID=UPI0035A2BC1E
MQYPTRTPPVGERPRARSALVSVLAANMLVDALEVSATLVALPSVGDDLALTVPQLQWLVSGFAAGFGGLLLLGGRLVEHLGRRPVFLAALLVFAAASLVGALTDSAALLTVTRVVKGGCVALTAPTGLAIVMAAVPDGPARRRAVSLYSFFGAAGFCSGLLLSGLLTGSGWRWTFAFPAPVALLLFAAGLVLVPRDRPGPRPAAGDRWRAVTAALGLTATVLLLVDGLAGLGAPAGQRRRAALAFAGALVCAAVLVRAERTAARPLLRTALLRHAPLLRSALGAAALNGSYVGFLLIATLHLREAGWSPWQTALAFLPAAAPLALSALHSARIATRLGPARAVAAGAAAAPLGYALYPHTGGGPVHHTDLLPATACVGVAFVLAFTALHLQATASLPPGLQAAGGGLYQTCVQLGAALTVALTSALYAAGRGPALWLVTLVGLAGAGVALGGLAPARGRHPPVPGSPRLPDPALPTTDGRGHPSVPTRKAL